MQFFCATLDYFLWTHHWYYVVLISVGTICVPVTPGVAIRRRLCKILPRWQDIGAYCNSRAQHSVLCLSWKCVNNRPFTYRLQLVITLACHVNSICTDTCVCANDMLLSRWRSRVSCLAEELTVSGLRTIYRQYFCGLLQSVGGRTSVRTRYD